MKEGGGAEGECERERALGLLSTMPQPWTMRLILNAAALAAGSPTLLFRPWQNAARLNRSASELFKLVCDDIPAAVKCTGAVCVLLLQDLLQSCSRGGGRRVEDMCYERRRAEACVD